MNIRLSEIEQAKIGDRTITRSYDNGSGYMEVEEFHSVEGYYGNNRVWGEVGALQTSKDPLVRVTGMVRLCNCGSGETALLCRQFTPECG